MSISVFPAPVAGSSATTFAATLAKLGTLYEHNQAFSTGVYTVTVTPSTTNARLNFVTGDTIITTQETTNGTVSFNLGTEATGVYIVGQTTGTVGAVVQIEKTADPLTSEEFGSGTLDTINSTSTYNHTGLLAVLVIGGGAGGAKVTPSFVCCLPGGAGGRAGFINGGLVFTNTPTAVTVGAKGIAEKIGVSGSAPGNSSFGNLITATSANALFGNGNGGAGNYGIGGSGNASGIFSTWNGNSTTGGGGGGNGNPSNPGGVGAGSGIGTGGSGSGNLAATAGTGKGSGGGGGRHFQTNTSNDPRQDGADGADGVVYVLRGF
jgi:hypothetical protein